MTKAQQIMNLHKQGHSTREIAEAVYGQQPDYASWDRKMAYVRIVIRQRKGTRYSANDGRYLMRKFGGKTPREAHKLRQRERYRDPAYRKQQAVYMAAYRQRLVEAERESS